MESDQGSATVEAIITARARLEISRLDYLRLLKRAESAGILEGGVAGPVHVPRPTIVADLEDAHDIDEVRSGFSGSTPLEIAQRHAIGELSSEQVVDELSRWEYVPLEEPEDIGGVLGDDVVLQPPGTVRDVVRALDRGLIDGDVYDAYLRRRHP